MKQKTQMQYLIAELIDIAKTSDTISINLVIGLAVQRLEKEKEQIVKAVDYGYEIDFSDDDNTYTNGEEYFYETFGDYVV
jgi:hypothetical protein